MFLEIFSPYQHVFVTLLEKQKPNFPTLRTCSRCHYELFSRKPKLFTKSAWDFAEKYKSPENGVFVPPKVNLELWKLRKSWQRRNDTKFISIQKFLMRTMNAPLSIFWEIHSSDLSSQTIEQKTADIVAILGQALNDIFIKRRVLLIAMIKNKYKHLCLSSQPVTRDFVWRKYSPSGQRIEFDKQTINLVLEQ